VTTLRVKLPSLSTATYTVAAVDTRGNVGRASPAVTVTTGHRPPAAPSAQVSDVRDTSVLLSWSDGASGSRPVAGHRIYRDGAAVGQVAGGSARVDGLAPATGYSFAVTAVDSLGYESEPSAVVQVSTERPPQTRGHVHAFLLASTDMSFRDLQAHYHQIGTLYPTYYECEPDGTISGRDDPLVSRWARLRGIAVLDRINCQSATRLHRILTDPATRAATLERLAAIAAQSGHEGLNLDFEAGAATDRDALTAFVADLAARLHAQGRRLAVEVSAKVTETFTGRSGFYDYAGLARSADTIFVMAWGKHWTTSAPGAIADLPWATRVANYVATMPDRSRFVFGTGLYGIDWANGGGPANPGTPLEYADVMALMARVGAVAEFDPVAYAPHFSYVDEAGAPHEVWYTDARTVAAHVRLAADRRLGFGVWRLGAEDQEIWNDPLLAPLP
jgi:spore germination protein YaaH